MAPLNNTRNAYGWLSRLMHWLCVLLVACLLVNSAQLQHQDSTDTHALTLSAHLFLGCLLMLLTLARLLWRGRNPNPVNSYPLAAWQRHSANLVHRLIYLLLLILGLTGAVSGILPDATPHTRQWALLASGLHHAASTMLFLILVLHIAAALYNQLVAAPE